MTNNGYLQQLDGGLAWGPLVRGILIRRFKRFLVEVEIDGQNIIAHTANTGRMIGCSEPERTVWLSHHNDPKRKYPLSLEMIEMPSALVGVNTMVPNRLIAHAAGCGLIPELGPLVKVEREVVCGQSRLDLRLTSAFGEVTLVEIKNCTWVEDKVAYFPDAVTARGTKHMAELASLAEKGQRAAVLILVQRGDADVFAPADHLDPQWGKALRLAQKAGVSVWAWRADLNLERIKLDVPLPVRL